MSHIFWTASSPIVVTRKTYVPTVNLDRFKSNRCHKNNVRAYGQLRQVLTEREDVSKESKNEALLFEGKIENWDHDSFSAIPVGWGIVVTKFANVERVSVVLPVGSCDKSGSGSLSHACESVAKKYQRGLTSHSSCVSD